MCFSAQSALQTSHNSDHDVYSRLALSAYPRLPRASASTPLPSTDLNRPTPCVPKPSRLVLHKEREKENGRQVVTSIRDEKHVESSHAAMHRVRERIASLDFSSTPVQTQEKGMRQRVESSRPSRSFPTVNVLVSPSCSAGVQAGMRVVTGDSVRA